MLRRTGHTNTATRLVVDTATSLQPELHKGSEHLAAYGSLLSTVVVAPKGPPESPVWPADARHSGGAKLPDDPMITSLVAHRDQLLLFTAHDRMP
ncbi:hypothetical protein [Nocardia carnea]|uniref:hypothetical protein n=1 Tax=Nocardia carnea TaxID=37328 RepID=UPI0024586725|nr:hypothetical protein [Nocardia carnea]